MARYPISEWQAEQLRLTAFPMPWSKQRDTKWWERITGAPPEELSSNPKKETSQVSGPLGEGGLVLNLDPIRIDWLMAPLSANIDIKNPIIPDYPSIGALLTSAPIFKSTIEKWLNFEDIPTFYRFAFGGVIFHPEIDRESGYSKIKEFVPINVDPQKASDFFLQINYPNTFRFGTQELKYNRLTKWSVSKYDQTILFLPIKSPMQQSRHAFRIEVDINTAPESQEPIPKDQLIPMLNEFMNQFYEIIEQGIIER